MIQTRNVLTLVCALSGAACADASPNGAPADGPAQSAVEADSHGTHGGHGEHGKPDQPYPTKDPKALKVREAHVREIYESLVFPKPIAILTGAASVDHLFERDSVKGRVTPVGQFPDFSAVVEYFYALAVTPGSIVDGVKFRSLLSGDDQVSIAVDIHFCRSPDQVCDPDVPNSDTSQTLTQVGFFRFNKQNRVISMDLNILNLGKASDPPNDPAVHAAAIGQLCTALTVAHIEPTTGAVVNAGTCTSYFDAADDFPAGFPLGASAFENCVGFMQSIPYGSWDRANSNTVTCRQLHTLLTAVDPDMHCPHASADGGGACIDFSYASYYEESF
ncbi:MAG TPA: hypothetical protein VGQ57_07680 [Polyangiaceae bacterium]|nr:hypothetical protein [Polyangiaceae bacterium]